MINPFDIMGWENNSTEKRMMFSNLCRGEDFGMLKCSTNSAWCNLRIGRHSLCWKPPETQPCRETRCLDIANHLYKNQPCQSLSWWHQHDHNLHVKPPSSTEESWSSQVAITGILIEIFLNIVKLNEAQRDTRHFYSSSQMISHFAPSLTGPWDW